jgi:hypothetical protein
MSAALSLVFLQGVSTRAQTFQGPRPLTEAERQAVVFATEYLDRGPEAWWEHLASSSPLRDLGREAALEEIEVRAGDPSGARWELQAADPDFSENGAVFTLEFPSGVDDTLLVEMVEEKGAWKIESLRISAEAAPVWTVEAEAGAPEEEARPSGSLPSPLVLTAAVLSILCLAGAIAGRRLRPLGSILGVTGALLLAGTVAALLAPRWLDREGAAGGGEEGGKGRELRALLPLRRELTRSGEWPFASPATQDKGAPGKVARLWKAQLLLGGMDLRGAEAILKTFPAPGEIPLAELLRARLGFLRLDEIGTALAYERALDVGLPFEGLLSESAQAFLLLGFHNHAKDFLGQIQDLGARRGDTYAMLARVAVVDDQILQGGDHLRASWRLQPMTRGDLLRDPLLVALLEETEIRSLVQLDSPVEPTVRCKETSRRAIALPAGFEARLLGEALRLTRGSARLLVPGGCALAPEGTTVDDAVVWERAEEAQSLERFPALLKAARTPGALAQPSLRRQVEETSEALAVRNRWADLLTLTGNLAKDLASLPPDLVRLRAEALRRTGREAEAQGLLIRLAKENTVERRTDPATLYQLADLLASAGHHDVAIRLVSKADSQLPFETDDLRIRRYQMEKRLAASSESFRSAHFDIRLPPGRGRKFAEEAAAVLEAERTRLQRWIPLTSSKVTEVHLLPFNDFRAGYSPTLEILGLYDGKIRVPLGEIPNFEEPFFVALLTHELAHAMIAERTGDNAPRWFHEGLAQHVQMLQGRLNPVSGYKIKGTLVSFPLIEPSLDGYSPALAVLGYDEGLWTLHYVEARYGVSGIHRLLDAFRAGKTTEEALASAFGTTVAEFDRDLWHWCLDEAPEVWKVELVRYSGGKPGA